MAEEGGGGLKLAECGVAVFGRKARTRATKPGLESLKPDMDFL